MLNSRKNTIDNQLNNINSNILEINTKRRNLSYEQKKDRISIIMIRIFKLILLVLSIILIILLIK